MKYTLISILLAAPVHGLTLQECVGALALHPGGDCVRAGVVLAPRWRQRFQAALIEALRSTRRVGPR